MPATASRASEALGTAVLLVELLEAHLRAAVVLCAAVFALRQVEILRAEDTIQLILDIVPVLAIVDREEHTLREVVERLEECALLLRVRVVRVRQQDRCVNERNVTPPCALLHLLFKQQLARTGAGRGAARRGMVRLKPTRERVAPLLR